MKIGHDFKVRKEDEKYVILDVGGYKILSDDETGVSVQGFSKVNLFNLPISPIAITPLDKEMMESIEEFPFEIEEHHLTYQVAFNNLAWHFNNRDNAYIMFDLILQVKETALHQKFLDSKD